MSKSPRAVFLSHLDLHLWQFRRPLMRALVERGCEVIALCPSGAYSTRFAEDGVRHESYSVDRASLNPLRELAVVAELTRKFRELRPDLIHSFTMKPNIYGALAASRAGVAKRVASVTGLGSFYMREERPLKSRLFRRGLDFLYGVAMRRVDRALFENTDDRDELISLGVCRPEQCVVIPGAGVDVKRFAPTPKSTTGAVKITMVARLIKHKGVEQFLDAAETLKAKWGDKVVFQLAGDEDPGNPWAADAARLADSTKRGIIKRLGFISDVPSLLRDTDVYTLPSFYREGTPVSVLEAMSAGLPVVTTDGVGCRETAVNEVSGLIVPVKNSAALTEALDRLIGDPALRARLGAAARKRAEDVFAVDKIVAAHVAVYRAMLPGLA
jgi:N,N'-diacetylbacillosaminyl-diphospho-undecaprenol alpha-1,3-N-acetylgalactosaminyltransferase